MIGRGGVHQEAGVWTTPVGPNGRYTFRIHVAGDRVGHASVRPNPRQVDVRIITPLGEHTAAAVAADVLRSREPQAFFDRVELLRAEADFVTEPDDVWDDAATAR